MEVDFFETIRKFLKLADALRAAVPHSHVHPARLWVPDSGRKVVCIRVSQPMYFVQVVALLARVVSQAALCRTD